MTSEPNPPLLLTVPQAAARLRVSRTTVYRLLQDGTLRGVTVRRSRRIPLDELVNYVQQLQAPSRAQK